MYKSLIFKKLSNHWYIDIPHNDLSEICLDEKIERCLTMLDYDRNEVVSVELIPSASILTESSIQFRDEDLNRYFTTNDDFDFIVYIGNRTFPISSNLYTLLEDLFNFNFHKELYSLYV